MYDCAKSKLAWHSFTLDTLQHILTYYDLFRIQLFLEIWIVSKEVDVGNICKIKP